jgi:outer membrane immunogenic protein
MGELKGVASMKKLFLTSVALTVLVAAPALAADLRRRPPPPPLAPPPLAPLLFTWTGCYAGGHVGGLWATKDWTDRTGPTLGQSLGSHDASSWLAGLQAGCDYQFLGSGFVVGLAGDYAWTDAEGTHADLIVGGATDRTRINSLASITGRIGYGWDRFLGYFKGGFAWEHDDFDVLVTGTSVVLASASETRGGWTVGVGGEYAFTPFLSTFVEFNYYDFGARDHTFLMPNGAVFGIHEIDESKSVLKGGLNFRCCAWTGPTTARY